nr:unnamed protein product [Spirometra erinaceieuropaei]
MENTPILRDIILNKGSWGLSHTRVPTESRPGHVALFAGFYEDVASVTKGWQANAVEFDSVVNRSNRAWIWGGPDVVPMLQPPDRIGDNRVLISSYPRDMLDFTAENITQIDDWVVDAFSAFMANNSGLLLAEEGIHEDFRRGNFIFLHLSAADQLGHTAKPNSPDSGAKESFFKSGHDRYCAPYRKSRPRDFETMHSLALCAVLSGVLVYLVRFLVAKSFSVPLLVNILSWLLLFVSPFLAVHCAEDTASTKLTSLALAFFVPFNLMNLFYEGFFFLVLAVVTFLWIWCESGLSFYDTFRSHLVLELTQTEIGPSHLPTFTLVHLRRPVFYVFLLIFSFFGTGNIASINTFDPTSIYCFMTVLNPATMGPMMILKLLCPMAMVGTGYTAIHRICAAHVNLTAPHASGSTLQENKVHTTVLLVTANFLAVHFFLMLRDEGSWLDIGSSISHYVIAMAIGLASLLLALAGGWMMGSSMTVHIGRPESRGKFE